jgi:hypothetical protein
MLRNLTKMFLILTMSFVLIAASTAAKAIDPVVGYFILGQLVNDARQSPVQSNTISLNPIYNTMWNGALIGANPDPRTMVAANCRGTQIVWEPGQMARVDIVGFELVPNTTKLPVKIAAYHEGLVKKDREGNITSDKVDLTVGQNEVITGNVSYAKWQLSIDTSCLTQGLYIMKIRVYFLEREASGFLKMGRRDALRREETICRFAVLDPDYMQQAANSPEIQARLRASFGLMGGPPQVGGLPIAINPAMAQNLPQPQVQPQPMPVQPQPQYQPPLPVQPSYQPPLPQPVQPSYTPSQCVPPQSVPQVDGVVCANSSVSVSVSASASSNCQPQQPSYSNTTVCATVCIWKGTAKQVWSNQNVDQNWFNQLVALSRQGGSRFITFKTRQGAFVASTEVRAQVLVTRDGPMNIVEFHIYRGDWPSLDCQMIPTEDR